MDDLIIGQRVEAVYKKGADIFQRVVREHSAKGRKTAVALSGGSTPLGMYRLLARNPYRSDVSWDGVHLFWVDERCVPPDHPDSNYGAARKACLDRVPIPRANIHPMPGELTPGEGAAAYSHEMAGFFRLAPPEIPAFDLIFLGVGEDGHTASLFPGQKSLEERREWVIAVKGGKPYVDRLTFTLPVLERARKLVFMVIGGKKAGMLRRILSGSPGDLPPQLIRSAAVTPIWLADREAARLLDK